MPQRGHEVVGIVGLGAVGGSLALALAERASVVAWARDAGDRDAARRAGIDVRGDDTTWGRAMDNATIIVIAVPLDAIATIARVMLPQLRRDVLLLHTGSLQRREAVSPDDTALDRVLGTHPLAGSERSGFGAARRDLFVGATVRAESRASEQQRERIEWLWREAGATRLVWNTAAVHDTLMARVSHLPQLMASALGAVLSDVGVHNDDLGPGAREMTRLASSDPSVWLPLLTRAPAETIEGLRRVTSTLAELADALQRREAEAIATVWERGRAWRAGSHST